MQNIVISPDLWPTSLLPEGLLERWRVPNGMIVDSGEAVAEVRIGEDLHEIIAPESGVLTIDLPGNSVVEPGTVIGTVRAMLAARHRPV